MALYLPTNQYGRLNYIGANTTVYHCALPQGSSVQSGILRVPRTPWAIKDGSQTWEFTPDPKSIQEAGGSVTEDTFSVSIAPTAPSKFYFSARQEPGGIELQIERKEGSGAAYFAAMAAINFLSTTRTRIRVNLIASHESAYTKELLRGHPQADYTAICKCPDRMIGRTVSFDVPTNGKSHNIIFRHKDTPATQPYCGNCHIPTVLSSNDIVQAISIKDKALFATIQQYLAANSRQTQRRPRSFFSISDLMIEQVGRETLLESFCNAHAIICNGKELLLLAGQENHDEAVALLDDPRTLCSMIYAIKPKDGVMYVTFDERGAVVMDRLGNLFYQKTNKIHVEQTIGCGDTFSGVLPALEAVKGFTTHQLLDAANAAGQLRAQRMDVTLENLIEWRKENPAAMFAYDAMTNGFAQIMDNQPIWHAM